MNIYIQCCGLAIMVVLMFSYFRQKRLQLYTAKAFICVFISTFMCVLLDIVSTVAIYYSDKLPAGFVNFMCRMYLSSVVITAFLGLMYVCVDIYRKKPPSRMLAFQHGVAMLIGVACVMTLPISLYRAPDGLMYIWGLGSTATYFFSIYFLVVNLVQVIFQKERINSRRKEAILTWMGLWVGAGLIQHLTDGVMVVSFAGALGIMVMYLKLENPMTNIERESGMFSHAAFMEYARDLYDRNKEFAVAMISCDYSDLKSFQTPGGRLIGREGMDYLLDFDAAKCFRKSSNELVVVFEDVSRAEECLRQIYTRFHCGWGTYRNVHVKTYWKFLPSSNMVRDAVELFYLLRDKNIESKENSEEDFIVVNESMIEDMYQKMAMEKLIDYALDNDRIEVYYQPIYSTVEKKFTSAEALVRIRDNDGNVVSPGKFIPIAEENGKILQIGERVFEKVCDFIKEHNIISYGLKYIEINLSVIQCADERLAENYIRIIKEKGIAPELINLEITESASLKAKMVLLENMRKLMDEGVHFSLDDFGTGQSNLNYIVDMPVSIVKFDREMTTAYFDNAKAKYVMDAAMHMIHGMELKIVSEGIENANQFKEMERLGIGYIQGYYFSKPLPQNEFVDFIVTKNKE